MAAKKKLPDHSPLGASSMKRWQACPGSVRLCAGIKSKSSIHAAEGTVAHWIAEQALLGNGKPESFLGEKKKQDGFDIIVTQEMIDAVQIYLDHLRKDIMAKDPKFVNNIEVKFHLEKIHPMLFGTNDFSCYHPSTKTQFVRDYKHGAGIAVEVAGNPQLLYYAVGALLDTSYPVETIDLGIVQPRCDHPLGPIRSIQIDAMDLLEWMGELEDAAKATEDPDAPLVTGEHCKKTFCPAITTCPKYTEMAQKAAKIDFAEVDNAEPDRLAELLEMAELLEPWCKRVREHAYAEAEHGREPKGWKLVQKRATRKWKDEERTRAFLIEKYKMDEKDIFEFKLLTPPKIEKIIGKENLVDIADLIVAESSGLALVREDDKREAVRLDPASDFTNVN